MWLIKNNIQKVRILLFKQCTLAPTNNGHPRHFLKIVVDARVCNIHVNNDKVAYIGTNLGGRYAPTVYICIYYYIHTAWPKVFEHINILHSK